MRHCRNEQIPLDGARIPTFEACLGLFRDHGRPLWLDVELKLDPTHPAHHREMPQAVAATLAALERFGMLDRAMLESFDWSAPRLARRRHPELAVGCLSARQPWRDNLGDGRSGRWTDGLRLVDFAGSLPRMVHAAGARYWAPYHEELTRSDLGLAHRLGLKVVCWTVDDPRDAARLTEWGVDGLISDYPDRLISSRPV